MKKLLITLLMLFTAYLSSEAQIFVTIGTDSVVPGNTLYSPIYRFSSTSGTRYNRSNILFTAQELASAGLPNGAQITGLSFDKAGPGATNASNALRLAIYAANSSTQPPLATTTTWSSILTSHTEVLNDLNAVIPATPGWVQFNFTTNLTYTGGSLEFATESEIAGSSPYATDQWDWKYTPGFADYIVGGVSTSSSFLSTLSSTTTSYKHRPNVRIHYVLPTGTDLGVQALLAPTAPVSSGSQSQVLINLVNGAATTITSAQVHYQIDNGTVVTESFSGNILSASTGQFGFATPFTIPANTFNLKVWVSNVNGGGPDNNTSNDTLQTTVCPALPPGNYTIGGTSPDYATIDAAVDRLNCGGINGPITFSIRPGTYTVSATLSTVPGAATGNSVTFTSSTAVTSDVIITPNTASSHVAMTIQGVQGVTFSNLSFLRSVTPSSASHLVHFTSAANGGVVINCNFIDSLGVVSSANKAVGVSNSSNMLIQNNNFNGFYYCIEMEGAAPYATQSVVSNNIINNYYYRAMLIGEQSGLQLINNRITNFIGTSTAGAGIFMSANSGFYVANNEVSGSLSSYGIYAFNVDGDSLAPSQIINNVVAGYTTSTTTSTAITHYGLYLGSSTGTNNPLDYLNVYHNTVNLALASTGTSTLQAGVYVTGGSTTTRAWGTLEFKNNNIGIYSYNGMVIPPNMRAFKLSIPVDSLNTKMDYNNFYIADPTFNLFRVNSPVTEYPTLADWRTATTLDSNSLSVDPVFATIGSGIPTSATLDNNGTPLAAVTTDITGAARNPTTPDIGAYEFQPNSRDLAVTSLVTPTQSCGLSAAEAVTISLENIGLDTIFVSTINMVFNNGTVVSNPLNRPVSPGDTIHFTFSSTVNMLAGGNYDFLFYLNTSNDGNPLNDTLRTTILNPILNTFPYLLDFESTTVGVATGLPNGWSITPETGFRFQIEDGPTSSTSTGPAVDHTLGTAAGKYIYSEASSGSAGDMAYLASPCLDLSTLTNPAVQFWYHMYGANVVDLVLEAEINGNWVAFDSIVGQQQTSNAAPWELRRTLIPAGAGAIRFAVERGTSFNCDVAIDDIRILENPTADLKVERIVSPLAGCALTNNTPVVIEVINVGIDTLFNNPVSYTINGGVASVGAITQINPGDTLIYTFPINGDFSTLGANYNLVAFNSNPNDGFVANDTVSVVVHNYPVVATFPYTEGFEANDGGWYAYGQNSSWAYGTPAGTVIDTAAAGTKAWVTNLSGNYNISETSYLQSPCFDFSNLVDPDVSFDIWWNTNGTAGVVNLAASTDGGQTWTVVGNNSSGISNWYNYAGNATSLSQPGWQGNPGSAGWLPAKHNVGFLAGQPSVSFRVQFYSSTSTIVREGVGIDNFSVSQRTSPIFTSLTNASDSCITAPRNISTDVVHAFPLTSVSLQYDLTNTGVYASTPMTLSGSSWMGTIPQSTANTRVTYRVVATDSASQSDTSATETYIDDYLIINAGNDTTILLGDSATLLASTGFTGSDSLNTINSGGNSCGGGVMFDLIPTSTVLITGFNIRGNAASTAAVVNVYIKNGTYLGAETDSTLWTFQSVATVSTTSGQLTYVPITPFLIQAGQRTAVFINYNASYTNGTQLYSNADLAIEAGAGLCGLFSGVNAGRMFNGSVFYSSPATVSWFDMGGNLLGTGDSLRVSPTVQTTYRASIDDGICSKSDSVIVSVGQLTPDIGVSAFISPDSTTILDGSLPVTVTVLVKNYGQVAASGFDVEYRVNGGVSLVTNSITQTLAPGDSLQHSFTVAWTPTLGGPNTLCANTTGVPGEVNRANDTTCITVQSTVSVDELLQSTRLIGKVYPNPAESFVNFEFNEFKGKGTLEIHDKLGRVVATIAVDRDNGKVQTIRTDSWSAGMYSYRFIASDQLQYGNLIINR